MHHPAARVEADSIEGDLYAQQAWNDRIDRVVRPFRILFFHLWSWLVMPRIFVRLHNEIPTAH